MLNSTLLHSAPLFTSLLYYTLLCLDVTLLNRAGLLSTILNSSALHYVALNCALLRLDITLLRYAALMYAPLNTAKLYSGSVILSLQYYIFEPFNVRLVAFM